jgi:hypothetical protein
MNLVPLLCFNSVSGVAGKAHERLAACKEYNFIMRSLRSIGAICGACLIFSSHAAAQRPISSPIPGPSYSVGNTATGPDGTYYVLVPGTGSTASAPVSELIAVGLTATPAAKWTASLTGDLGAILPGANTVFVVKTVVSGSGRTQTSTTSILSLSAATGAAGPTITPSGTISNIEVKTIDSSDYLYVQTTSTSTSQSNGTTTFTTTTTLTVYSQAGTVIKSVPL